MLQVKSRVEYLDYLFNFNLQSNSDYKLKIKIISWRFQLLSLDEIIC